MPTDSENLDSILKELRERKPALFLFRDGDTIFLRDYTKGVDLVLYTTLLGGGVVYCPDVLTGGHLMSFDIPEEGPIRPCRFKIGDPVTLTECGDKGPVHNLTVASVTASGNPRHIKPYWRVHAKAPDGWIWDCEAREDMFALEDPCHASLSF